MMEYREREPEEEPRPLLWSLAVLAICLTVWLVVELL